MKPYSKITALKGIIISNNTKEYVGEYLKLFSVDMTNTNNYKADYVYFKISDVQGYRFDYIFNLHIFRDTTEITRCILQEVEILTNSESTNLSNNLFVYVDGLIATVYWKVSSDQSTPTIKILSFNKYTNEELMIYSEDYSEEEPSGTKYEVELKDSRLENSNADELF